MSPGRALSPTRRASQPVTTNKNVEWLSAPGAWTFIMALIGLGWLILSLFMDSGLAWTYVHLLHGVITYYLLHWNKGSPVQMDQGKYDNLTFWEQLDDGVQNTNTRKFLTIVPVALFLLATHGTDYRRQPLGLNLIVLLVLVIAKFPAMHKVRIFGINKY
ncbi:ORM1-like protein 3 [Coccomyxa sp. Obi]|nr:ORM1-like protein 3 [Coccomyxa sp. Obi]